MSRRRAFSSSLYLSFGWPPSERLLQYSEVVRPHRRACSASAAFSSAVQRNVIFSVRFTSMLAKVGKKILLSKARKARNVRHGHFLLYKHTAWEYTHAFHLHSPHTSFSLFPYAPDQRNTEKKSRVRSEKTAQLRCAVFSDPDLHSP